MLVILVVVAALVVLGAGVLLWRRKREGFAVGTSAEVMFFHSPGCPWCRKFYPAWEEFQKLAAENNITTRSFNCKEGECENAPGGPVLGYPTLRIRKNGRVVEYEGDREPQKILEAVLRD